MFDDFYPVGSLEALQDLGVLHSLVERLVDTRQAPIDTVEPEATQRLLPL